jgi:hypothetical protein
MQRNLYYAYKVKDLLNWWHGPKDVSAYVKKPKKFLYSSFQRLLRRERWRLSSQHGIDCAVTQQGAPTFPT